MIKGKDSGNLIDKTYFNAKDLNNSKYQFLVKKQTDVGIKYLNDLKLFIEYSNTRNDVYNNDNDYNLKSE